jgi:hypothetical protein
LPAPDPLVQDAGPRAPNPARFKLAVYALCALGALLGWFDYYWAGVSQDRAPALIASAALLVIPLAALGLALTDPARFEVGRWRPTLNVVVVVPFVGLLIANLGRGQLLSAAPAIAAAAVGALAALAIGWSVRQAPGLRGPRALMGLLALCGAGYGWGAATVIDVQFDLSAGRVTPVQVLDKHTSYGRQSTNYWLDLPPWGPRTGPASLQVDRATFNAIAVGGQVCITTHPGTLGMAWYTAGSCAAAAGLATVPPGP